MNVLILEIDHEIQRARASRPDQMKAEYRRLLEHLISENQVEFVGEEAHPDHLTVAKQVSDALHLRFPWANVDMPQEVREQRGIAQEQRERFPIPQPGTVETRIAAEGYYKDLGNGWHEFTARVPSDDIREDYMYQGAIQAAPAAASIMVLCGILHAGALEKRFRDAGHVPRADSVQRYPWYSDR
jgi:hypothetical protein